MASLLARAYRRIGIHAAPPGTIFFVVHSCIRRIVHRRIFGYASGDPFTRSVFGGVPYYDIAKVRKTRAVGGLALVYFMGAGDYLMTTPLIRALHLAHPDLPIYAFASTHADSVNSPLLIPLLEGNPLISRVITYRGRPRRRWTDYDFADALDQIPPDFVILPVIYDVDPVVFHRATSLMETFGLPVDLPVPRPIAYEAEPSSAASDVIRTIVHRIESAVPAGVVCVHFGARSSGYEYPHAAWLVRHLLRRGVLVVAFSPTGFEDDSLIHVDVAKISIADSIEVLRAIRSSGQALHIISVNSVMWPISAALDIPNLGMHAFWDPSIHQYLYPNLFVITQHLYPRLPPSRCFLAPPAGYEERRFNRDLVFTDYRPEFVADCFETMLSAMQ